MRVVVVRTAAQNPALKNESATAASHCATSGRLQSHISRKGNIMRNRFNATLAAVAAVSLVGFAGSALAQPAHPHGGPGKGGDFVQIIAGLKSQLNLNTSQQAMWDAAVTQTKAA